MRSHEENRSALCALCFDRTKEMRKITPKQEEIIKSYFINQYSLSENAYPTSLCSTCRLTANEFSSGTFSRKVKLFDYSTLKLMCPCTRSKLICTCTVCSIARSNLNSKVRHSFKKQIGRPLLNNNKISRKKSSNNKNIQICSNCYVTIKKGRPHDCRKALRTKNFAELANLSGSPKFKERFASTIVQERIIESQSSSNVQLTTGTKKHLTLTSNSNKNFNSINIVSIEDLSKMQQKLNLSINNTIKLASCLNKTSVKTNRKVTESYIKSKLQERRHLVDEFFSTIETDFKNTEEDSMQPIRRNIVFCKDLLAFLEFVLEKRKIKKEDLKLLKIGLDGGGGFFKVCLNIQANKLTADVDRKDSGVKKIFILAIVKNIKENYSNVRFIWQLLNIDQLAAYNISTDLKLANILMGIMSHSSAFPCTWCQANKQHLNEEGVLRTFENIRNYYSKWVEGGRDPKKAKNFFNCVHEPIPQKMCEPVIRIIPPPELHLLLGTVNTLYTNLLKLAPEACNQWTTRCHVQREAMHGGSFTGNSCKKLLNNLQYLEDHLPINLLDYVTCLKAFKDVTKSAFKNNLDLNYKEKLNNFKSSFLKLGINITPKIHAVFFHVKEFCETTNEGLGIYSEQASEAVHSDFTITWNRFKVHESNPAFSKQLLAAVTFYNSSHI